MVDEPGGGQAFGDLLREQRVTARLSQEQLAERAGLGVRTIRELERGRVRRPHRESVVLLATALGLSPAAMDELARAGGQPSLPQGPAVAAAEPVCPAQLPAGIPDFTGRLADVAELSDLLAGPPEGRERTAVVVCAITGVGGIGKTSLALHAAHQVRDQFPDGQLFVDLRGTDPRPLDPGEVLARFLRDLGMDAALVPADPEERGARYRSLVARRQVLVVLDNASDAEQVLPLLPGGPGCAVLVTSRSHLPGLPAHRLLDLQMLEPADAETMLARIIGPGRAAAEPDAMAGVVAACAGLPLAIRIAGTRLLLRPGWTISSLADRLADHRRRLAELGVADLAVQSSFETSYRALVASASPGGADPGRVFRLLGLPTGPDISLPAAGALLGQSEQDAEAALQTLVDAHLLDEPVAGRYRMHDLLRMYAAERAAAEETAQVRDEALGRLFGWQLRTLSTASEQWCETERDNLLASVRQAAECGMDDLACQFGIRLYSYLDRRGHYRDLLAVSQIGLASARVLGDRPREAAALNNLGLAYGELHQLDAATETLTEAVAVSGGIVGLGAGTTAWGNLGNLHQRAGRYREALRCFQHAIGLARLTGLRSREGLALLGLGDALRDLGRTQEARAAWQEALAILTELDSPEAQEARTRLGQA